MRFIRYHSAGNASVLLLTMFSGVLLISFGMMNLGSLFLAKQRLQIASDRAAFAGAAAMSADLNQIAYLNREIADTFRTLQRRFAEESVAPLVGRDELNRAQLAQRNAVREMQVLLASMPERAQRIAESVFFANAPHGRPRIISHVPHFLECDESTNNNEPLRERLDYDEVQGALAFDPDAAVAAAGGDDLLRRCEKIPSERVMIRVEAEQSFSPPLAADIYSPHLILAASAAQPASGDIGAFAEDEMEDDLYAPEFTVAEEW